MVRRGVLGGLLTAATAAGCAATARPGARGAREGIVLYCDLEVDPAREAEMLRHFHTRFKPAGARFRGYVDVKMLKLNKVIQGAPPPRGVNYRFQLTYENEALRQIWVNSQVHTEVWAGIEATLLDKTFQVLLFDNV